MPNVQHPTSNVAALLAGPVAARPDAPALVERDRVTTFAQLDLLARRVAALLRSRGVGVGDGVLFFEPPSAELYATLAAVFRLGAVAMFVEPSAGRAVLEAACAMWPPRALVATPKAHLLRLLSPALRRVPVKVATRGWVPGAASLAAAAARVAPLASDDVAAADADAPALLTFTSGSTGAPKAAVRTHGILRAQLHALGAELTARAGERELVSLPIVVLLNLASGAETVLPDADLRRPGEIDARPVLAQLRAHGATRITASPAFLERLAEGDDGALARVATVLTGGGPVFPDIVARLKAAAPRARVISVYGSTEAEPIAHVGDDEVSAEDHAAMRAGAGLLAGAPDPVVRLRIVRARWGEPIPPLSMERLDAVTVPAGETGEIVVAGPHVVRGYLHGIGDAETKFRVDGEVWHRTGDLGRLDERGRLWLLGRASAMISDARGTLHPFAVECAARTLLGGRRVAAVAHEGRRLLVVEGESVDAAAVREALAWARLDAVRTLPRIPMDRRHNSKVDYGALARVLARAHR